MYYLSEFKTEGKNTFKDEYSSLQTIFFENDSTELRYSTKYESG